MAYLPESEQDKQRRMQEQGGQQGPQVASGASGVITGAQAQPTGMAGAKGPSKSGAYTNLNSYIQANKPQAAGLAQNVADNVAKQADKAKDGATALQGQFQNQASQSGVSRNQDLVKEAVANPTNVVNDQAKLQQFKQMRDAQYQGPQGLQDVEGYTDTRNQFTNANQALENTKSEAGRFSLVQEQFKKPSYSRGQQRLDQLLLQNSPEARQTFQDVQGRYSGLMGALTGAETQAADFAKARQAETAAARQDVQSALGTFDDPNTAANEAAGAFGDLQTGVKSKTEAYKQKQADLYARAQAQIAEGKGFDADVMQLLGLNEGENLYNVNLASLNPTFNAAGISEQNVASAEDYGRYKALAELAGVDPSYLYDPSQAGKATGVQYDSGTLRAQVENAKKQYGETLERGKSMSGQAESLLNFYAGMPVQGFTAADATPERIRKFTQDVLASMRTNAGNAPVADEWAAGRFDMGDTGARAYKEITEWLKSYDALNPSRTVTRKS